LRRVAKDLRHDGRDLMFDRVHRQAHPAPART
jgi:hypothetical protein